MRVLVTGAAGYVGSALVPALAATGHKPVALVHRRRDRIPVDIETRSGDILDTPSLVEALAGIDSVCHLAGLGSGRESLDIPVQYFRVNVGGTLALLDAMAAAEVRQMVFASTAAIYGTPGRQPMNEDLPDAPPHPYAASKAAAEAAIAWQSRTGALGATVLRIFNAAGGDDPDPWRLLPRALAVAAGHQDALEINGDGSAVRDYLHVADAADAFVAAVEHQAELGSSRRYNIGSGAGTTVMDIVTAAERVTGKRVPVIHRPAVPEAAALICDPSHALEELCWKPRRSELDDIVGDAWKSVRSVAQPSAFAERAEYRAAT